MDFYGKVFSRVNYKVWIVLIPLIGLLMMPFAFSVKLGIDFTGGTEIQILTDRSVTSQQYVSALSTCLENPATAELTANVQSLGGQNSVIIKTKQEITKNCSDQVLSGLGFTPGELDKILPSTFKPELGKVLLEQGSKVFLFAGILMSIVVFLSFRSFVPSIAVIEAAAFDITIGMGVLSLLGFQIGLPGFAAMIMLIGYSVDTDIMLTANTLKSAGKPFAAQLNRAFATGMTMTGAAIATLAAMLVISMMVRIDTITQISAVLVAGLSADMLTTWFTNAAILKWYVEKPKSTKSSRFKFSLFRS